MKCLCGHKNKHNELDEKYNIIKENDNKFIKINGNFTVVRDEDGYHEHQKNVFLYACPICNTIQMKERY